MNGFDLDEYSAWLSEYRLEDGSICRNSNVTKRRKLTAIRSLFHFLYTREMISCNPSEKAVLPTIRQKKRKDIRILENDECTLLLNLIDEDYKTAWENAQDSRASVRTKQKPYFIIRDKAIIYLFLGTGLRVSELCAIDCTDIVFSLGYINVIRKEDLDDMGASDRVFISDEVAAILKKYITEARPYIEPDDENHDALFLSSKHCRMTPRAIEMMIKDYADRALGTNNGITPHKLRATFGTRYQREFGDISATSTVMNHADISVTAKYYLQEDKQAKERVRDISIY